MSKWEYKVASKHSRDGTFEDWLNSFGKDDWELVKYDVGSSGQVVTATFKRPA
jgi:hypothetical protein